MKTTTDTKEKLLDVAQNMIQTRGYNAFSYADITKVVNIRKASIHYYFPSKGDLGIAVTQRYREIFSALLNQIETSNIAWLEKIRKYTVLYKDVLSENRLCLCGALATDMQTLPKKLQIEVRHFFNDNLAWLQKILPNNMTESAQMIIATLQGGMMIAKNNDQIRDETFATIVNQLIDKLNK